MKIRQLFIVERNIHIKLVNDGIFALFGCESHLKTGTAVIFDFGKSSDTEAFGSNRFCVKNSFRITLFSEFTVDGGEFSSFAVSGEIIGNFILLYRKFVHFVFLR